MDSRQKEWFAWPAAKTSGATCVSCHTGLPYLLARPALCQKLGQTEPTTYEKGLLESLRSRLAKNTPAELYPNLKEPHASEETSVEAIFAALFLATEDARQGKLSAETKQAFDRMWALQQPSGAWPWNEFKLDPYETPESAYFGAALAALATGIAPEGYRSRPDVR